MGSEVEPPVDNHSATWEKIILVCLSILLFIPLLLHAYIGVFARYVAEDFCHLTTARSTPIIQYTIDLYMTFSGRFTFPVIVGFLSPAELWIGTALPSLTLGFWLLTTYFFSSFLLKRLSIFRHHALLSLILSELMLFSTHAFYGGSNDIGQITYWFTGIIMYTLPLAGLIGNLALILHGAEWISRSLSQRMLIMPIIFLGALFLGGSSEPLAVMQIAILMFIWGFCKVFVPKSPYRSALFQLILIAGIGAAIGLALEVLAPGNYVRQDLISEATEYHPRFDLVVPIAFFDSFLFLAAFFSTAWFAMILMLVLPAVFVICFRQKEESAFIRSASKYVSWALPLTFLIMTAMNFAPAAYALGTVPSRRSMLVPAFLWTVSTILWSMFLGIQVQRSTQPMLVNRLAAARMGLTVLVICAGLIIGYAGANYQFMKGRLAEGKQFASDWDRMDATLRNANVQGERDVAIALAQNPWKLDSGVQTPTFWVNTCIARFYDLDSVSGLPVEP
jgi:hypothetical protein